MKQGLCWLPSGAELAKAAMPDKSLEDLSPLEALELDGAATEDPPKTDICWNRPP